MIFIFEEGNVVYDGSTISEKQKSEAIVITERPVEETIEGKYSVLKWDVEKQTAWYEYENIPPTETQLLEERLQNTEDTVLELIIMGGM